MAKKNVTAATSQQNGESTSTNQTSKDKKPDLLKLESPKAKQPDIAQLIKENEAMKKKLSIMPDDLEGKITFYQRKQELIKKYDRMGKNLEVLKEHREKLSELSEEDAFFNDEYFLKVNCKEYSRDIDIFKIQNPAIIGELIDHVLKNMEVKREALKTEINA